MNLFTKLLVGNLHKKRDSLINQTLKKYRKKHGNNEEDVTELRTKLGREADRLYPMVDKSIARSEVYGAGRTFAVTAGVGVFLALMVGAPWFVPLIAAVAVAAVSLYKIREKYNSRIEGGLDSVVYLHQKDKEEKKTVAPALVPDIKKEHSLTVSKEEKTGTEKSFVEREKGRSGTKTATSHAKRHLDRKGTGRSFEAGTKERSQVQRYHDRSKERSRSLGEDWALA